MKRRLFVGLCLMAMAAQAGQQQPQPPVFRADIALVEVEVFVLDRNRRPVRGLTVADFTLLEDGAPREIETFAAIELPPPPSTPWMREVAPDVRGNAPREGRLIAIVLDDGQLARIMLKPAKETARRLIGELSPGDLAAVIFTRDNSHAQEFTEDKAGLLAAVDSLYSGVAGAPMPPPPRPAGAPAYIPTVDTGDLSPETALRRSVSVLGKLAASLGEAPKRRKALVYVGPGVPLDPNMRSATGTVILTGLEDIVRDAQRSNVTVYALDPGLRDLTSVLPTARREFLSSMAERSGGFVAGEKEGLAASVDRVLEETGTYYLLGYQSPGSEADGRFRPIEVKLARSDLTVRARSGSRAPGPATAAPSPRGSELQRALAEALPRAGLEMRAFAAPFAGAGRTGPALALVVGIRQPAPGDGARVKESVELLVSAFAGQKLRSSRLLTYGFGLVAGGPEVAYELVARLDVPPGSYQLRIAGGSATHGKTGSVYYDVEVPDFAKLPLSLSGLLLTADPATVKVGEDRLAGLLPVVPTSMREFSGGTRVTAFARVYQRAKAAADLTTVLTLLNGKGARVFRASEPLGASQFDAAGAADYLRELPLGGLEPGEYLLTLEVKRGEPTAASRSLRFAVVP